MKIRAINPMPSEKTIGTRITAGSSSGKANPFDEPHAKRRRAPAAADGLFRRRSSRLK
jgi:hypothetical protein